MVYEVPKSKASIKQNRFDFKIGDKTYSVPLLKFISGAVVEEMAEAQVIGGAAAMAAGFRLFGAKGTPEGDAVRTLDGEQLDALADAYMEASGITVGELLASTDSSVSTERPSDTT